MRGKRTRKGLAVPALVAALLAACTRAEPPAPAGVPWVASPEGELAEAAPKPAETAAKTQPAPGPPPPAAPPPAPSASSSDSASLPQTNEKPAPSSPELDARAAALWDAIARDEPDAAIPAFFPLAAYQQVKDVADPSADWKRRLVGAFRRDIHAYHAALGDDAANAKLVSLDVPDARARWVEPGEEWNKIGYFRVFGSKLRYQVDGASRAFEIKSLISWRGQWYVVHLAAIK
jgi:hypothetical protein